MTTDVDIVSLDPAALAAQARHRVGVDPDTRLRYLDGLAALTDALDAEAGLSAAGRGRVAAALVTALTTQLQLARLADALPPPGPAVTRPVFITGMLRSGTTFLQHLLSLHPGLRAPALWELMAPVSPEDETTLVRACEEYVEEYHRVAPDFRTIHPLGAHLPEECHRLTANAFAHPIYALRYQVPSYARWLRGRSMAGAYGLHQLLLRAVLHRRPGSTVVLKCPSHLWYLDDLAQVYPDATVIRLHRSPAVTIPSVCSLTAAVRVARASRADREQIGQYWLDQADQALTDIRRDAGPLRRPPLDIRYADLVADPLGTAARVCDHIGVPLTDEARRRMSAYLSEQSPDAHRHRYQAEKFGLTTAELERRFAGYIAEFDL